MSPRFESLFEQNLSREDQLKDFVVQLKPYLENNSIILLSGELGSGKTTTTRYLCELYSLHAVQSPTYAIHQQSKNKLIVVDHFDLYRMKNEEDLLSTGFWDFINANDSLVIIEWFEKIKDFTWLETESQRRKIYGIKISINKLERRFEFLKMI